MKKIVLFAVALAYSGAVAQEKQVWACQQEVATILGWDKSGWTQDEGVDVNFLLTINENLTAAVKSVGDTSEANLTCEIAPESYLSCLDNTKSMHFLFNSAQKRLGFSSLYGSMDTDNKREPVSARIYTCVKF